MFDEILQNVVPLVKRNITTLKWAKKLYIRSSETSDILFEKVECLSRNAGDLHGSLPRTGEGGLRKSGKREND